MPKQRLIGDLQLINLGTNFSQSFMSSLKRLHKQKAEAKIRKSWPYLKVSQLSSNQIGQILKRFRTFHHHLHFAHRVVNSGDKLVFGCFHFDTACFDVFGFGGFEFGTACVVCQTDVLDVLTCFLYSLNVSVGVCEFGGDGGTKADPMVWLRVVEKGATNLAVASASCFQNQICTVYMIYR